MKNLLIYYLAILLPLPLLLIFTFSGQPAIFTFLLLVYALPYRMAVDGSRLVGKGILNRKEVWKLLIPGTRIAYFRELYFRK